MNVDDLTGVELRRAVAEAVGWEWHDDPWGGEVYTGEERTSWTQWLPDRNWNHAIKACEAAGICRIETNYVRSHIRVEIRATPFDGYFIGDADGHSSESLCRALLNALEAKHAND